MKHWQRLEHTQSRGVEAATIHHCASASQDMNSDDAIQLKRLHLVVPLPTTISGRDK